MTGTGVSIIIKNLLTNAWIMVSFPDYMEREVFRLLF